MPDPQNAGAASIVGARVPIVQVGISNFRLPLSFWSAKGDPVRLETSVTGTVSLAADKKGINMSRIMRIFYRFEEAVFSPGVLEEILRAYQVEIGSERARLRLDFSYPMRLPSLRSGASGWQYYQCAYEGLVDGSGTFRQRLYFDFVYSSACPCAAELAEHARRERGIPAIGHSQRSKARIVVVPADGRVVTLEDLQAICARALQTETQVMVRREDEQAFAEINSQQTKFVEDAARLLYAELAATPSIADFQATCAHLESLHSHDAVAVIAKGIEGGFDGTFDDFKSLIC